MDIEREYLVFGELIKAGRVKAGLSQDEIAEKLKLSRVSIANIESGRQRVVLHQAMELSRLLNFSLSDLEKKMGTINLQERLEKLPEDVRAQISGVLDDERDEES